MLGRELAMAEVSRAAGLLGDQCTIFGYGSQRTVYTAHLLHKNLPFGLGIVTWINNLNMIISYSSSSAVLEQ